MSREKDFFQYIIDNSYGNYNPVNIVPILENLEKADRDNRLYEFFMNKKPYKSAFWFVTLHAIRNKDQCSIVLALNIYGADHPGFVYRLNKILKQLIAGTNKEAESVIVLMRAQMELQYLEKSLINFVDAELMEMVNQRIKKLKKIKLLTYLFLVVASDILTVGMAITVVMIPFSIISGFFLLYCIVKSVYWACIKGFKDEEITACARPIGDYKDLCPPADESEDNNAEKVKTNTKEHITENSSQNIATNSTEKNSKPDEIYSTTQIVQEQPVLQPVEDKSAYKKPIDRKGVIFKQSDIKPVVTNHAQTSVKSAPQVRFCSKCSKEVQPQHLFCSRCGTKLK